MFEILTQDPLGQIVLANIKQALDHKFIEQTLLIDFLSAWKALYQSIGTPLGANEVINLINSVDDLGQQYLFRHIARPPALPDEVSTVIRWEYLRDMVDPDVLNLLGISLAGDQYDENLPERLAEAFLVEGILLVQTFGNPRNYGQFWITHAHEIAHIRDKYKTACADQVRDALGLVHINANVLLIELRFPSKLVPITNIATPTFIEAGSHRRFKAYESPCTHNNWGLTVYLQEKYCTTLPQGKPELVAKFVTIDKTMWQAKCIGYTNLNAENTEPADKAKARKIDQNFADTLWQNKDMKAFLDWLNTNIQTA